MINMASSSSSQQLAPLMVAILIILTNLNQPIDCEESNQIIKVPLNNLPEPFTNDKLPYWNRTASKCFELLGCIERLPNLVAPQEPEVMKTEFKIFTKDQEQLVSYKPTQHCLHDSSDKCSLYPFDLSDLIGSNYNPNLRTIILTPGYLSNSFEDWMVEICKIWLKLEDINCILVSWAGGNKGLYQFAVSNTKIISRQITVLLYYIAQLNNLQLSDESFSEKIYLIGHSLGAHISGFVGQDFGGKVGRITGLDAAGPTFVDYNQNYRLDSSDAQLVDAIHTNGGNLSLGKAFFGIEMPIGHLDYYANDGKHQPNCNFYAFGCSHTAACSLFTSFLKHELYMREKFQLMNANYHDYHRIFAYKSDDYDSFHNGSSLIRNCPIATLNETDLLSEDITHCLVPIDFITWFDKLKLEFERNYNIDFNPENGQKLNNKFFFYTSAQVPYLNHHNLIRIRVTKSPNLDNIKTINEGCDIMLAIKMANGMGSEHMIKRYNLTDEGDHYEIIVPYLSPNTFSKYSLAELDSKDFFPDQKDDLQSFLAKIFPTSIVINGLTIGSPRPTKGIFDTLLSFFNVAKDESSDRDITHHCSLNIESVAVQPMKKLHRKIVAIYSAGAQEKKEPDLIHLFKEDSSATLNIPILPKGKESKDDGLMASEIFIDTVVIGIKEVGPEETGTTDLNSEQQQEENQSVRKDDHTKTNTETSSIRGSIWLTLTISLILTTLAVSIILYKVFLRKNEIPEDKFALVV